jgi:NitT/TauT family transport system substrate-binding protein
MNLISSDTEEQAMSGFRGIRTYLMALLVLIMTGCGAGAATPTSEPPTEVNFQMAWIHEYSSAGYYTAELNKHFADQHLNVILEPGGFVGPGGSYVEPIDEVVSGKVDFGSTSATSLLQARADGKPVVAISTVLQRNPTAIIFFDTSNIQQPKDLVGKTVAVSDGGARQLLEVLFTSQGIDPTTVNIVPRVDFGVDPLLNGDVDAMVGWITNEGVAVKEAGKEPSFMLFSDYGIPDYAALIFTTEDTIKNKPELVERFLRAVLAGWEDVVKTPEVATDDTLKYNDQLDRAQQLNRVQASIPLLQPARANIGAMDAASWEAIYKVLKDAGVITADIDVNTAFTTSFLDKIYAK